ncbi:MAG: hypothetical protein ACFFD4_06845 [Candidatus Odinarchaeota archaeon]
MVTGTGTGRGADKHGPGRAVTAGIRDRDNAVSGSSRIVVAAEKREKGNSSKNVTIQKMIIFGKSASFLTRDETGKK